MQNMNKYRGPDLNRRPADYEFAVPNRIARRHRLTRTTVRAADVRFAALDSYGLTGYRNLSHRKG